MEEDDNANTAGGGGDIGPAMGPIYTMWENSLEKLKILNYEKDFCKRQNRKPFHRVSFVLPAANSSHQFDDFSAVCSWLCSEITMKQDTFKPEQFDDPNTIVNKLLLALRQLDFRSNFPPTKFKTPFGEPVCTVLEFLTDKALTARGFQWQAPVYAALDDVEQPAGGDDDEENEDIIEDEMEGGGPEGTGTGGGGENDDLNLSFEENMRLESSVDSTTHHIIQAAIDPIEWKTELERVGPKLKANVALSTNEWRSHVDQTLTSKTQIEKVMTGSHSELQVMNKQIGEELNQMKMKEKYLNNQYNSLCLEFVEVKHKLEELEKKSGGVNEIVSKKTNELAEISEKLEDLKESFESKDSGLNDTSPLVKIKAALQQLKEEIHSFDMRIGVVSHTLLSARISDHNRLRAKAAKKAKQRHRRGHKGISGAKGGQDEDNSGLSGEDE